jgi:hypothetical protein
MRGLTGLLAAGAFLFGCSVPALGEGAGSQTTLSALTSAFGEVAEKQAFADGSYVVTLHQQHIPGTASADFTIVAGFNNADGCIILLINTTASDNDIPLAGAYSKKVAALLSCYPEGGEANLKAFQRSLKPSR